MTNETIKAIMDRRSIRRFLPDPLTAEQIEVLSAVALASPTAMNRQPWQFHFISNPTTIEKVSDAAIATFREQENQAVLDRIQSRHSSIFYGAPLLVIITLPKDSHDDLDAGIAVENLAIAAQSMGLGSCIIGLAEAAFTGSNATSAAEVICMPKTNRFAISIAIGYPEISKEAHETHPEKITWVK